jgi:hypothetical protein
MRRLLFVAAGAALLLAGIAPAAQAKPSCTGWMKQTDGSYFRTCVDDKGTQYCESKKNGRVTKVSCS